MSIYTAAFIAEVVRAGILAVAKGQTEAAYSLGLRSGPTLRLVVIPQAMRVIMPPLTSQYLNLTKNSSLAVAIGYPDLVQIFAGTVLNQTGQAVEVIVITMAVYLAISLVTSGLMNLYNRRMALVERMSDIATTTDAKLMAGPAFVRAQPIAPLPPPLAAVRRDRLDAAEPVLQRAQHRADHRLRAADRLDRAAARQIPGHRRGVGRQRAGPIACRGPTIPKSAPAGPS